MITVKDILESGHFVKKGDGPILDDEKAKRAYSDFFNYAKRGVYAFDWLDVHRTRSKSDKYELVARPTQPITINDLPNGIQPIIYTRVLYSIDFNEVEELDIFQHFDCGPP